MSSSVRTTHNAGMESVELVQLAMVKLDCETPAQLARKIGLTEYGSPKRVSRWLSGENEPDYKATIALLDALGLLRAA